MPPERRVSRVALALVLFVALALTANRADAQLSYRLAPVGGRSQLLGGTGMAFGRDASASFLNPSSAVLVDDQRLSFSVNFYKLTILNASNWYAPGPVDRSKFGDIEAKSASLTDIDFDTLPSSLCFFFTSAKLQVVESAKKDPRTSDAHVGLCFATVESQEFNFGANDDTSVHSNGTTTRQSQTVSQKYTRFAAGPTYAIRVNNALSLGASVHASVTSFKSLLASNASTFGGAAPITSSFYAASKGSSFQVEATLGASLRFGKQTLGLSVRLPSLHVFGRGGANRTTSYEAAGGGPETSQLAATGTFAAQTPLRIGLGTGVEDHWGSFEVDAFYYHQLGNSYQAVLDGTRTVTSPTGVNDTPVSLDLHQQSKGVINLAAGAELFMSDRISFLTGLSTDVSAAQKGALQGTEFNYFGVGQNRVAGTFGIGTHGTNGELMIGSELTYGWGERLAVNSYRLPPEVGTADFKTYQLMVIVAGSTSLRAIKRAVEDVKRVVSDPTPQKPVLDPSKQDPASSPTPQKPASSPTPQKPAF